MKSKPLRLVVVYTFQTYKVVAIRLLVVTTFKRIKLKPLKPGLPVFLNKQANRHQRSQENKDNKNKQKKKALFRVRLIYSGDLSTLINTACSNYISNVNQLYKCKNRSYFQPRLKQRHKLYNRNWFKNVPARNLPRCLPKVLVQLYKQDFADHHQPKTKSGQMTYFRVQTAPRQQLI